MTAATFATQLEALIPNVRRYARKVTGNADRAADLAQTVLLRALEKQHLWQQETDLRAWLFTIMHNEYINGVRQNNRAERYAREWLLTAEATVTARQIPRVELSEAKAALAKLPDERRQAVLLVGVKGMSYDEAAAALHVPVGTVRTRLYRGRKELRQQLNGGAEQLPEPLPVQPERRRNKIPAELEQRINDALKTKSGAEVASEFKGEVCAMTVWNVAARARKANQQVVSAPRSAPALKVA
jgi:RNA polymerase sigma-70 factor, ECF subfamily